MKRIIFLNFFLMITIVLFVGLSFLSFQQYLAEFNYLQAIKAYQKGQISKAIDYLEKKATRLNPNLDLYWRDLAHLYLTQINLVLNEKNLSEEEKKNLFNRAVAGGGRAIEEAVRVAPVNVANWNVRGFFYRNLIGLLERAEEISLKSYQKAVDLEPASPYSYGEKGRVYILAAQEFSKKNKKELEEQYLDLAEKELKNALNKKPDYSVALYLLAVVYDQKKDIDRAIAQLEETKIVSPKDIRIIFPLGLLYWRKGEIDKAEEEFKKILDLNQNYSYALYMLGVIYDKKGEKELAKEKFQKVLQLNPESKEIKKILENLEKGLPALEGINISQSPLKEEPIEVKSP